MCADSRPARTTTWSSSSDQNGDALLGPIPTAIPVADPMVGTYEPALIVELIEDPVPAPEPDREEVKHD
jgi:hypothetical protein